MYRKEYYEKNKEKFREYSDNWRENNYDKFKEYQKNYYKKNKEKIVEKQKEWRGNNKDKWIQALSNCRRRRVEKLREEGVTNAWGVVIKGAKPKYK